MDAIGPFRSVASDSTTPLDGDDDESAVFSAKIRNQKSNFINLFYSHLVSINNYIIVINIFIHIPITLTHKISIFSQYLCRYL